MTAVSTESCFKALFNIVKTIKGKSYDGTDIPLLYTSRNWIKKSEDADSIYPCLYQFDPLPERDRHSGRGRNVNMLHAAVEVRMQRGPQELQQEPFGTILNNWRDAIYQVLSPWDLAPTDFSSPFGTGGLPPYVADIYPVAVNFDYGLDAGRVAIVEVIVEMIVGG